MNNPVSRKRHDTERDERSPSGIVPKKHDTEEMPRRPRSDRALTVILSGGEQRALEIAADLHDMDDDSIYCLTLARLLTHTEKRDYYGMVKGKSRANLIEVSACLLAKAVPAGHRVRVMSPPTVPALAPVSARILAVFWPRDGEPILPASGQYSFINPKWNGKTTKAFPLVRKVGVR
jgi:hypothetical protein